LAVGEARLADASVAVYAPGQNGTPRIESINRVRLREAGER